MVQSTTMEALFDSVAPPDTDETVRDYVCSLLENANRDDDEEEDLIATIQAVLEASVADDNNGSNTSSEALAKALVSHWKQNNQPQNATANSTPAKESHGLRLSQSKSLGSSISTQPTTKDDGDHVAESTPVATANSSKSTSRANARRVKKGKHHHLHSGDSDDDGDGEEGNGATNDNAHQDEPATAINKWSHEQDDDDFATAWKECQQQGEEWGGRGRGGRGVQAGSNSIYSNIHLANVTLSVPGGGLELLQNATIDLVNGHRYGLIGRNGVGKSTLLLKLAQKAIPGIPQDLNILLVKQQIAGSDTDSALQVLLQANTYPQALQKEQAFLEKRLETLDSYNNNNNNNNHKGDNNANGAPMSLEEIVERLGQIAEELDAMDVEQLEQKALEILKGLQFTQEMIHGPTQQLSGGWRMRLALARALFVPCDLLLLDEPSNHLDLHGIAYLIKFLTDPKKTHGAKTVVIVSHDKAFLDAVCTDITVMKHGKLKTHPGNYSEYERQQEEKTAREKQILDASERQRTKAMQFVQKQQAQASKKSADPNKQRQAKMIKEKKMERIGNYREDGKRYKNFSLQKLDEDYIRVAQKVEIDVDDAIIKMRFPDPTWPSGVSPGSPLVQLEQFSFGYGGRAGKGFLLRDLTLNISRGSKIALVGRNGSGKSTLLKLLTGDIRVPSGDHNYVHEGQLSWRYSSLRVGHVTQYSVEEMESFASMTIVQYAEEKLAEKKAAQRVLSNAAGNIRQYLGAFGLGGQHALRQIAKLSGGERMRLCFATVLAEEPHVLCLDECTNHMDLETIDSMSAALNSFQGAVLMVSHNQGFLSGFCKELWVVEDDGHVTVNHSDTETFDEIFSEYRSSIMAASGDKSLSNRRREKASMAKKATQQRTGASQKTALL